MKQEIRIIGGTYRGKKIQFPDVEGLRPTSDRIKETLFNWLMHDIRHARCLDAFAGSGSLGIEAFSRGAAQVVFIEQSPIAHAHLKKTLSQFNSNQLHLIKQNTLDYLQHGKEQYDIIFLDPPFSKNLIEPCLDYIAQRQILSTGGLVYLESAQEPHVNPLLWQQIKQKKAGQVIYSLYKRLHLDKKAGSCFNHIE